MANIATKQKVTKTAEGLLVHTDFSVWESSGYRMTIIYLVIGEERVKVGLAGIGNLLHSATLESEAEYNEFDIEEEYLINEISAFNTSSEIFDLMGQDDGILEIIFFTEQKLKDEY